MKPWDAFRRYGPAGVASARADQVMNRRGVWELAGQAGLKPSPESHFRSLHRVGEAGLRLHEVTSGHGSVQ